MIVPLKAGDLSEKLLAKLALQSLARSVTIHELLSEKFVEFLETEPPAPQTSTASPTESFPPREVLDRAATPRGSSRNGPKAPPALARKPQPEARRGSNGPRSMTLFDYAKAYKKAIFTNRTLFWSRLVLAGNATKGAEKMEIGYGIVLAVCHLHGINPRSINRDFHRFEKGELVKVTCDHCKEEFLRRKKELKPNRRGTKTYCSRECTGSDSHVRARREKASPSAPKQPGEPAAMVHLNCTNRNCKKELVRPATWFARMQKRGGEPFCSTTCYNEEAKLRRQEAREKRSTPEPTPVPSAEESNNAASAAPPEAPAAAHIA